MSDKIKDGGPAFPQPCTDQGYSANSPYDMAGGGMSLRDYFAAKAMQALISAGEFIIDSDEDIEMSDGKVLKKVTRPRIQGTETAFKFADAMLEAREK
jgi:hypothetical protein